MKINKFSPLPSFRKGTKKFAGRNNTGQITVRHRGGGHKQSIRPLDWQPNWTKSIVVGFDYDPQRTTSLIQLYHKPATFSSATSGAFYSYQIATQNRKPFQTRTNVDEKISQKGDISSLSSFEPGDFVHSVELYPGQGARVARSAGSFCQIRSSYAGGSKYINATTHSSANQTYVKIRLPSGSQRLVSSESKAVFGVPGFDGYHQKVSKKAGRTRWYGWRPSVRGVARNPVDHPHGGGQGKTSGGRPSVTFKAWPTKGQPTRSSKRNNRLIVLSRKQTNK